MSAGITLKFESKKTLNREDKEIKDELGEIIYERNDIAVLEYILQLVDSNKIGKSKWLTVLSIEDKVRERYRAEAFDCEIEFSVKESGFLQELFENLESKLRNGRDGKATPLSIYHLRTWRALNAQLNDKEDDNNKEEENKG